MDKQNDELDMDSIQLLTLILSENQRQKCIHLAKEQGICGGVVMLGRGTVSSTVLNLLGIKNQRKEVVKFLLKKDRAEEMMDLFDEALQLKKPGHGIAYTTAVISAVRLPEQRTSYKQVIKNTAKHMEGKSMFKKLTVIVDYGMSNDVMNIARKAGARGGTILHGRGVGAEIDTNLFGVEIEPEKELVIILIPNDKADKVVDALTHELRLDEPGKGILLVEPVLDTRGLFEMTEGK